MHAIVSIIDEPFDSRVGNLWSILERRCGLSGIRRTPIVHFSWQIAENYQFGDLTPPLKRLAGSTAAFRLRTAGLALFTGQEPVLYVPIVRTPEVSALHVKIWEQTQGLGESPSEHYHPRSWMPHITLAHGDLNLDNLDCAVMSLADRDLDWEIPIDNLALIQQEPGQAGQLRYRLPLTGGLT